jgi:hypothetical protein
LQQRDQRSRYRGVVVHAEILMLRDPEGAPVCNVAFDLSAEQLSAAAHAASEIRTERHRGATLSTDDVLAMRELTGVVDELAGYAEAQGHKTVTLPLARMVALHDALDEWLATRELRGWMRGADETAHPLVAAMVGPMGALRADAVRATLEAHAQAPGGPCT